jgi:diacylglycerol kinase (ATP)
MRIILMHNPKAGRGNHARKELMAALANAGHHAITNRQKKSDYKKALKKPVDVVLVAGGDGTVGKVGREFVDSGVPLDRAEHKLA